MKIASKVLAAGLVLGTAALAAPAQAAPRWAERMADQVCRNLDQGMDVYRASFEAGKTAALSGYSAQVERAMENGTYARSFTQAIMSRCPHYIF